MSREIVGNKTSGAEEGGSQRGFVSLSAAAEIGILPLCILMPSASHTHTPCFMSVALYKFPSHTPAAQCLHHPDVIRDVGLTQGSGAVGAANYFISSSSILSQPTTKD